MSPRQMFERGTACAYCTQVIEDYPEDDHVFPESWYAPERKRDEMLFAPACRSCNNFFGRWENKARTLVLTFDPDDPLTQAIQAKVWQSMTPSRAKSEQDRRARANEPPRVHRRLDCVSQAAAA